MTTAPISLLDVDPAQLEQQLEAAEAAREQLNRIIGWLEDGLSIFTGTPAPPELPSPAASEEPAAEAPSPETPPRREEESPAPPAVEEESPAREPVADVGPGRSAGMRDVEAKVLSVILKSNRPVAPAEIYVAVGADKRLIRRVLKQLVDAGSITVTGQTVAKRYAKAALHEFHTEMRVRQEATASTNRERVADGIARVVFRDKVAKAIAGQPGQTIEQLVNAVDADHDDVAEACAWLVEHHQAVETDGTYARHTTGRARMRAAA